MLALRDEGGGFRYEVGVEEEMAQTIWQRPEQQDDRESIPNGGGRMLAEGFSELAV